MERVGYAAGQRWVGLRKRGGGDWRVPGAADGVVLTPGDD